VVSVYGLMRLSPPQPVDEICALNLDHITVDDFCLELSTKCRLENIALGNIEHLSRLFRRICSLMQKFLVMTGSMFELEFLGHDILLCLYTVCHEACRMLTDLMLKLECRHIDA